MQRVRVSFVFGISLWKIQQNIYFAPPQKKNNNNKKSSVGISLLN